MRDAGSGSRAGRIDSLIFPFDSLISKLHAVVFIRNRYASLAATIALYGAVMLSTARALGVSCNYFVIAPIVASALGFGTFGGFVAGALGLPANLLIFALLGHPEFSPASKIIAEFSGLVVGLIFGRLADYFREVEREIKKRMTSELALRAALAEKELLLRELRHRVKNNLNVMKSLVQLQRNRSKDPTFLEAVDDIIGRIFAISLVHEQLDRDQALSTVEPSHYIEALVANLASGLCRDEARIDLSLDTKGRLLPVDSAVSLGLIVNEVLMNTLKHACPGSEDPPSIRLSLAVEAENCHLTIADDGPGPGPWAGNNGPKSGLGIKLVQALALNLGGTASLGAIEGPEGPVGAIFDLSFPVNGKQH